MTKVPMRAAIGFGLIWMALFTVGCGGSDTKNTTDGGTTIVTVCTADAKSCLNSNVATQCASDGKSLVAYSCNSGDVCKDGACVVDPAVACTAAANTCMDASTALRCSATGKGFDVVTCPKNTACIDHGICQGACTVGASYCDGTGTVMTCSDGLSYTPTSCPQDQYCVNTSSESAQTATCKAGDCSPTRSGGCDTSYVCGNPNNTSAPNQQTTLSHCVETPTGFRWSPSTCTGGSVCSATQNSCGNLQYSGCTQTQCTPGQTACYDDGYQTCGADGNWSTTITACNAANSTAVLVCIDGPKGAVCGDAACSFNNPGVCDGVGQYHACGTDGKVSATATPCASGLCVANGDPGNSSIYRPGQCVVQCQNGDQRCTGSGYGTTYETCAGGLWGTAKQCAGAVVCIDTTSTAGRPAIFCGECINGTTSSNGNQIETCAGNKWGAATACTVGVCQNSFGPNGLARGVCRAECVPNTLVCQGNGAQDPVSYMPGTTAVATCDATGKLGTSTNCDAGKLCRTGPSSNGGVNPTPDGYVLGCVTCVGGQNAFGLPDTRCSNVDDTATTYVGSSGFVETCKADSSGWDIANHFQYVAPQTYCQYASYYINLPSSANPNSLHPFPADCGGDSTNNGD